MGDGRSWDRNRKRKTAASAAVCSDKTIARGCYQSAHLIALLPSEASGTQLVVSGGGGGLWLVEWSGQDNRPLALGNCVGCRPGDGVANQSILFNHPPPPSATAAICREPCLSRQTPQEPLRRSDQFKRRRRANHTTSRQLFDAGKCSGTSSQENRFLQD